MADKSAFLGFDKYTVALICPLEVELSAARFMLDEEHKRPPKVLSDQNHYIVGKMSGHNVVLASLPTGYQGTIPAATVANNLGRTFRSITLRLLVGIGGGVPCNADVRLGDVVISMPSGVYGGVVEYNMSSETPDGLQRRGFLCPTPKDWLHVMTVMQSDHRVQKNRVAEFLSGMLKRYPTLAEYRRPAEEFDLLFRPDYQHDGIRDSCTECDQSQTLPRQSRLNPHEPVIHYGVIASVYQVVNDSTQRDLLGGVNENILCVEMEAAGLMNDFPCIVIRGISDYADSHKNDTWKAYAAAAAAGLAKELLTYQEPMHVSTIIHEDELNDCMRALRCTNPPDDKKRIEISKDALLKQSYNWILGHSAFRQWMEDKDIRMLWIKGDPGKGKTMIMIGLIEEISGSIQNLSPQGQVLSYFFCQSSNEKLNSASSILRGLLYLLISQDMELSGYILNRYLRTGAALFEGSNVLYAIWAILVETSKDPRLSMVYLMIDALDECNTELSELLELIRRDLHILSNVKWIVASRYHSDIENRLLQDDSVLKLDLEANETFISEAVNIFIEVKISELPNQIKRDTIAIDTIRKHLQDNAQGTFLWVALVCKRLREAKAWRLKVQLTTLLKEFPPGLKPLYRRMLEQIQILDDFEVCCQILSIVLHAFRPLHIQELAAISDLGQELVDDPEILFELVALCGSFLLIREDTVDLVHQSAREFLMTPEVSETLGQRDVHDQIACQSLNIMNLILTKNISQTDSILPSADQQTGTITHRVPIHIQYSCCYWIDHVLSSTTCSDNRDAVSLFFYEHVLHWSEAVTAMGQVSRAISMVTNLVGRLVELDQQQPFLAFLRDARRFLLGFRSIIQNYPPEIYNSALIFAPLNSLIRQHFIHEIQPFLDRYRLPMVEQDWSATLFTLEGHSEPVSTVVFSPNGKIIASGSLDSDIRIWDATTGAEILVLRGHSEPVNALAFISDGTWLASAGDDELIHIWNIVTGSVMHQLRGHTDHITQLKVPGNGQFLASAAWDASVRLWDPVGGSLLRTLSGHSESIDSLALSRNGNRLASGSQDGLILIWNPMLGEILWKLEMHWSWVHSLVFSKDDKYLVSGSADGSVRTWNPTTGVELRVLNTHTDEVRVVSCSPDGTRVASASDDYTICIWDAITGELLHHLKGHSDLIFTLRISPDGHWVASGSSDTTVRIWDMSTGKLLQTLRGHLHGVNEIAVASDGRQLASAAYDNTVRVWDPSITEITDTEMNPNCHSTRVNALTFSPCGSRLASGCHDATVGIWDPNTGKLLHVLSGHLKSISRVAFSRDGSLLVSGSSDKDIRVWDPWAGIGLKILTGHTGYIGALTWSSEGTLASGSDDQTVRLWNVTSGETIWTMMGHSEPVITLAFSKDGSRLASGSDDRTVRVWDPLTGNILHVFTGHSGIVNTVLFSTCGTLVSGSQDGTIRVWVLDRESNGLVLNGHLNSIRAIAFLHDERYLVSGSFDNTVRVWDIASQVLVQTFEGFSSWLEQPAFLNNNGYLTQFVLDSTRRLVMKGGSRVVFLPVDRCGEVCASKGGCLAIAHRTGYITFVNLISA